MLPLLFTLPFFCHAQEPEWPKEFLMVLPDATLQPKEVVAAKTDVAMVTQLANTALSESLTAQNTVESALEYLADLAATSNQFGFVNGSILSFGKQNFGADTNAWGVVTSIDVGPAANGKIPIKIGTWFSGAIDGAPDIITTDDLQSSKEWETVSILGFTIENNVLIGGTVFDPVYVLEFEVSNDPRAFIRTKAKILKGGIGEYFAVQNGIQVGNEVGTTVDITFNGVRRVIVGGVIVRWEVVE